MVSPTLLGRVPARAFVFAPGVPPRDRYEEERFRDRLRSALRAAAGLGVALRLDWDSGPRGTLRLTVPDAPGGAWFRHVLAPAYGHDRWRPVRPGERSDEGTLRLGALAGSNALPLPFAVDRPPWCEVVLQGLSAAPSGVTVEWDVEPGAIPPPVGRLEPSEPSGPVRSVPLTAPERAVRDRTDERRRGAVWVVRVRLRATRVGFEPSPLAIDQVGRLIEAATRLEGGNGIRFVRPVPLLRRRPPALLFSEPELVGLLPTPWAHVPPSRPQVPVRPGLPVARTGMGERVCLPVEPDEGRHLVVLGETGMGKSTLLTRALTAAVSRGSVVVLDPVGDVGRRFLSGLEASARARAVWISPTHSPLGINALSPEGPAELRGGPGPVPNELVAALRRVRGQRYSEGGFWGPRIEEVLHAALTLARSIPDGTLVDAYELVAAEACGTGRRPSARHERALRSFEARVADRPEEVAGARRVLGEVARDPVLRTMLCAPSARYRLREALRPGAITVVTAEAGTVGESTARAFLGLELALLWASLLARPSPTKLFLALDEAQWYAHDALLELLRLGRRANVHVLTTTQSLRSLPEEVREALLTNAADLVLFRGDPESAREFARWRSDLTVDRLLQLERGQAAFLLGKASAMEFGRTEPLPPVPEAEERLVEVARSSAERWGAPGPGDPEGEAHGTPVDLLERLRTHIESARAAAAPGAAQVELGRLREECAATPEALRRLGGDLKAAGVLLRSYASPHGTVWELAPPVPAGPAERAGDAAPRGSPAAGQE
jgi:hypothetical protein